MAPAGVGTASVLAMAYVLADQFVADIPGFARVTMVQSADAQETPAPAPEVVVVAAAAPQEMAPARPGGFGLGRTALPEEIAAWDIDVRPDGLGLPAGSGDVWTGEEVFVENCAVCHGDFGEAVGRWPVLAGGRDTLTREDPVKTIGSYWPYLSTVYDYINRAMPFGYAQSLEPDDIYAITAYLLYVNDIVGDDFELSNENFLDVAMPNADNFFMDDRAEAELPLFSVEPCMESCKASVEITMHASVLDVTPETEEDTASATPVVAEAVTAEVATAEVVEEVATEAPAAEAPAAEVVQVAAAPDPALVAAGEGVFRACRACHQVGEGATNRSGPHLNGVVGRVIGSVDGFRYSNGFAEAASAGTVWTQESLAAFLADPRGAMPGTKMSFRGISNEADIAAMIAYLESFGG
jgi:cytochrome c